MVTLGKPQFIHERETHGHTGENPQFTLMVMLENLTVHTHGHVGKTSVHTHGHAGKTHSPHSRTDPRMHRGSMHMKDKSRGGVA